MRMRVDSTESRRFRQAVELLKEGIGLEFNGVSFWLDRANQILHVSAFFSWQLDNVDRTRALEDIRRGASTFAFLQNESAEFSEAVKGLTVRYSLTHDYGNGSVEIAYLADEKLVLL